MFVRPKNSSNFEIKECRRSHYKNYTMFAAMTSKHNGTGVYNTLHSVVVSTAVRTVQVNACVCLCERNVNVSVW